MKPCFIASYRQTTSNQRTGHSETATSKIALDYVLALQLQKPPGPILNLVGFSYVQDISRWRFARLFFFFVVACGAKLSNFLPTTNQGERRSPNRAISELKRHRKREEAAERFACSLPLLIS
jgi:hypothetical protein